MVHELSTKKHYIGGDGDCANDVLEKKHNDGTNADDSPDALLTADEQNSFILAMGDTCKLLETIYNPLKDGLVLQKQWSMLHEIHSCIDMIAECYGKKHIGIAGCSKKSTVYREFVR